MKGDNLKQWADEELLKYPADFKEQFKGLVGQINTFASRQSPSKLIITHVESLFTKLNSNFVESQKPVETSVSDQFSKAINGIDTQELCLTDTIKEEILKYADGILGQLLESHYGKFILSKIVVLPIYEDIRNFSQVISLIRKVDAKCGVDRDSLLMLVDIAWQNFEYFDYTKWRKLSPEEFKSLRKDSSVLMKKCIQEALKSAKLEQNEFDSFNAELHIPLTEEQAKWAPIKRVDRERQIKADLEIARWGVFETLAYYFDLFNKSCAKHKTDPNPEAPHERTIIRCLSEIRLIITNNIEHFRIILKNDWQREEVLDWLALYPESSKDIIQLVSLLLWDLHKGTQQAIIKDNIAMDLQTFPDIMLYLHKLEYTPEELELLGFLTGNYFSHEELKQLSGDDLQRFFKVQSKYSLCKFFSKAEDKQYLVEVGRNDQKKFAALTSSLVFKCLEKNVITVVQLKEWDLDKIQRICGILTQVKNTILGDAGRLGELYNSNHQKFENFFSNPLVIEGLSLGHCTIMDSLQIVHHQQIGAIFRRDVMKGCRMGFLRIEELKMVSTTAIKALTSHNAIKVMEDRTATFQALFTIYNADPRKFYFVTSSEALSSYQNGRTFAERCMQFNANNQLKRFFDVKVDGTFKRPRRKNSQDMGVITK